MKDKILSAIDARETQKRKLEGMRFKDFREAKREIKIAKLESELTLLRSLL